MNLLADTIGTLKTVGIVVGIFAGVALLIGILILVVGKVFKVNVDEKVTKILENLAGANCGGCGCSGCSGFASKLASGEGNLGDCHVTSDEKKAEIAKLLGIELTAEERTVAVVKCLGGLENCGEAFEYHGNPSCASCASLLGGNKLCKSGCLGCGDCADACSEKGVTIEGGLSKINPDLCISCGACIAACPKNIIERIPASAPVYAACSSHCRGKEVSSACKVGCIGCGLCARACPNGAVTMVDNLPVFDYSKCTGCLSCADKCPRHIIVKRDVAVAQPQEAEGQAAVAES